MDNKEYRVLRSLSELEPYPDLAVDTECDSLNKMEARLLGVSFCGEPGRAFWLPAEKLRPRPLERLLRSKRLIFHHAKFDLTLLQRHGVDLTNADIFDTLIAAHLLDENRPKSLKRLARDLLGDESALENEGYFDDPYQLPLFGDKPTLEQYACADADYTFQLFQRFKPHIDLEPTLAHLYYTCELPTMRVLRKMEMTGFLIDTEHLKRIGNAYRRRMQELELEIWAAAGKTFRVNSPIEIARILYADLSLPATRQTRRGRPSVNQWALEALRHRHPVVPLLLEHREMKTLLDNYVDKLPQLTHPETGRIHCSFNQTGTVTGRLSSNDPNLQAIPRGDAVRSAFVAGEGRVLIDVDFSQVELRCAAHYARDPKMMAAFQQEVDLHKKTIADMLHKPIEDVTPEERALAKAINFGLIYGMGAKALSATTGLSLSEAEAFIDAYFTAYKKLRSIRKEVLAYTRKRRYIVSMFGRRRRFPKGDARTAFNSMIQGTAADICRAKMIRLDKELPPDTQMLAQIHDEIVFEAPAECAEERVQQIVDIMQAPVRGFNGRLFRAPIRVEAGWGPNWGAAK